MVEIIRMIEPFVLKERCCDLYPSGVSGNRGWSVFLPHFKKRLLHQWYVGVVHMIGAHGQLVGIQPVAKLNGLPTELSMTHVRLSSWTRGIGVPSGANAPICTNWLYSEPCTNPESKPAWPDEGVRPTSDSHGYIDHILMARDGDRIMRCHFASLLVWITTVTTRRKVKPVASTVYPTK